MGHLSDRVYQFPELSRYSFAERILIRIAGLFIYFVVSTLAATLRFDADNVKETEKLLRQTEPPIFATWHDRIFTSIYRFRHSKMIFLVSQSFDGEYIARILLRFGYGVVRGSSSRGGTRAMLELIRQMRGGKSIGFTVDGPRGPRYKAKPGVIYLAKETASPVVPGILESKKFWTIKSWDKLQLPKPFSRVRIFAGDAIYVRNDDDVNEKLADLQSSLDDLVARAEMWRTTGN